MRVTWEVEDGYVGKSRPQHTDIDDEDLEACDTEEERQALITDTIEDDFLSKIT